VVCIDDDSSEVNEVLSGKVEETDDVSVVGI
jgi:hypothetical protein